MCSEYNPYAVSSACSAENGQKWVAGIPVPFLIPHPTDSSRKMDVIVSFPRRPVSRDRPLFSVIFTPFSVTFRIAGLFSARRESNPHLQLE